MTAYQDHSDAVSRVILKQYRYCIVIVSKLYRYIIIIIDTVSNASNFRLDTTTVVVMIQKSSKTMMSGRDCALDPPCTGNANDN